jgi:hypothetical protein
MKNVLVEGLRKHAINLLCEVKLHHLELSKTIGHDGIVEVHLDHTLEHYEVFLRELTHALVQHSSNIRVTGQIALNDILNVLLALSKRLN